MATPTSYPDLHAKDLIRITSCPVRELGDMSWAYMGPADAMPDLPDLEMALVPASHRFVTKKWQDCNWVQAMEGSIDTAHFTFAHLSFDKEEDEVLDIKKHFINPIARMNSAHMRWIAEDPRPVIRIQPHAAGLTTAGGPPTAGRRFGSVPASGGGANVGGFLDRIPARPTYMPTREAGAGFVELVDFLLAD